MAEPQLFRHYPDSEHWAEVQRRMAEGDKCAFEEFQAQAVERERQLEDYLQTQFYEPLVAGELGGGGGGGSVSVYTYDGTVTSYNTGTRQASITRIDDSSSHTAFNSLATPLGAGYTVLVIVTDDGTTATETVTGIIAGTPSGGGDGIIPGPAPVAAAGYPMIDWPRTSGSWVQADDTSDAFAGPYTVNVWIGPSVFNVDDLQQSTSWLSNMSGRVVRGGNTYYFRNNVDTSNANGGSVPSLYVYDETTNTFNTVAMPTPPAGSTSNWSWMLMASASTWHVFVSTYNTSVSISDRGLYWYTLDAANPGAGWTMHWFAKENGYATTTHKLRQNVNLASGWRWYASYDYVFDLDGGDAYLMPANAIHLNGYTTTMWLVFAIETAVGALSYRQVNTNAGVSTYTFFNATYYPPSSAHGGYTVFANSSVAEQVPVIGNVGGRMGWTSPVELAKAGVRDSSDPHGTLMYAQLWVVKDTSDPASGTWLNNQGIYDLFLTAMRVDGSLAWHQVPWCRVRIDGTSTSGSYNPSNLASTCALVVPGIIGDTTSDSFLTLNGWGSTIRFVTADSTFSSFTAMDDYGHVNYPIDLIADLT